MAKAKKKTVLSLEERLEQALVPEDEQPYLIPGNWCWTRLGTLINTSKEKKDNFSDEDERYVGLEHMEKNGGIIAYSSAEGIKSLKNVFHPKQILYGKLRPYLNKHDIATFDGICSTDILVFATTQASNPNFINFFFSQPEFLEYVVANSKGINLPRVSEDTILQAVCPLPPLNEQQRIVDRIECLFAKLDEAKEKAQAALDSFETRKAAILHKAFTGELTAKWREENGVGMDSWNYIKFDNCIDRMQNGLSKRNGKEGSEYAVLRLANLSDSDFITDDMRYIILDEKEQQLYKLHVNDVVMIRVNGSKGNVGRQILVNSENEWAFCDHLIRIKYNENIALPQYIVYFARSDTYRQYIRENMVSSAGQNTISRKGMAQLKVPLTDISEQYEIVRLLDDFFVKEQKAKELCSVLDKIDLIKKSILARAFRGELGTNDPTEKSAMELLKSIV